MLVRVFYKSRLDEKDVAEAETEEISAPIYI